MSPRFKFETKRPKKKTSKITRKMMLKTRRVVEDSLDAQFKTKGYRTKWRTW